MPYNIKQCRVFRANPNKAPDDWKEKCKGVTMKDSFYFADDLQICDKSFQTTDEGYLMLEGIISRSGKQEYKAFELGFKDGDPNRTIIIDRPADEVTNAMSVASFMHKPVTDNHPMQGVVNSANIGGIGKGFVTDAEATPGGQVKASFLITNNDLVDAIKAGKRELSAGYSANIEFSDDGTRAVQTKIRGNHVAFVDKARCGRECSIFDSDDKEYTKMGKMTINGVEMEINDSAAPMVKQLQDNNEALKMEISTLKDANDISNGKLDAANDKVKELESQKLSDKDIVDKASELLVVWKDAELLDSETDYVGMTAEEIRRKIVTAKLGDSMAEKSDVYIQARFEGFLDSAKEVKKDPLADQLSNASKNFGDGVEDETAKAREAKMERSRNAYKTGK